ncbi:MAG: HAD family hydrolase [Bulleidia sp.]
MKIRLLAVDMDGTCLNPHNRINTDVLNALQLASDAGIMIVPTTGRSLSCLPHQLRNTDIYRYVISSNGAVITDTLSHHDIFLAQMDEKTAADILHRSRFSGLAKAAHINHEYLMEGHAVKMLGRIVYGRDGSRTIIVHDLEQHILTHHTPVEELQFFFLKKDAKTHTEHVLKSFPQVCGPQDKTYVEIYSDKAGKGNALSYLQEYLRLPKESIACIGDGENDIQMFENAGFSIAMGNGHPQLKQKADLVVASNDNNGVKEAIEHILRIQ